MKVNKFRTLGKKRFELRGFEEGLQDSRLQPKIKTEDISRAIIEMVPFNQKSLLEVDQIGRLPSTKAMYKTSRPIVVSDTTMTRSLDGLKRDQVRQYIYRQIRGLTKEKDLISFNAGKNRGFIVGAIDGSVFGNEEGSVLAMIGKMTFGIDFEESPGRGHELSVSDKLLKRAGKELGKGLFDLITGDGLYFTEGIIKTVREDLGSEILIKTDEENLDLIKDARGLFFRMEASANDGIERVEGVDANRNIFYKIKAASGFKWRGYSFKVAWVYEKKLKPQKGEKEEEEFFVLTTKEDLLAEEMREIAHGRWLIENNVFKRLNSLVGSKSKYVKNKKVKESLLLLWFVGLMILSYAILSVLKKCSEDFKGVKITLRFLRLYLGLRLGVRKSR